MKRLLILGTVLLSLTACDSDDPSTKPSAQPTTTKQSSTDESSTAGVDSGDLPLNSAPLATADPAAPGHGTDFCAINAELDNTDSPFSAASPEPDMTKQFFTKDFPTIMARLAAAAPADLVDSIKVLNDAITAFGVIVEGKGWDINAAYSDPAVARLLGTAEFQTADGKVADYCGQSI